MYVFFFDIKKTLEHCYSEDQTVHLVWFIFPGKYMKENILQELNINLNVKKASRLKPVNRKQNNTGEG